MILGIGADLMEARRILSMPEEDPFFQKVFTEQERRQAAERPAPLRYYASHFAGKEAVCKALSINPDIVRLNDIEILNDGFGRPAVTLYGTAAAHALAVGITDIHISLSWETELCLAFAVAEGGRQD